MKSLLGRRPRRGRNRPATWRACTPVQRTCRPGSKQDAGAEEECRIGTAREEQHQHADQRQSGRADAETQRKSPRLIEGAIRGNTARLGPLPEDRRKAINRQREQAVAASAAVLLSRMYAARRQAGLGVEPVLM